MTSISVSATTRRHGTRESTSTSAERRKRKSNSSTVDMIPSIISGTTIQRVTHAASYGGKGYDRKEISTADLSLDKKTADKSTEMTATEGLQFTILARCIEGRLIRIHFFIGYGKHIVKGIRPVWGVAISDCTSIFGFGYIIPDAID